MTDLSDSTFSSNFHDLNNFTNGSDIRDAKILNKNIPDIKYSIDHENKGENYTAREFCHKSHLIYKEYNKNYEENTKVFNKDGYFRTEEICRLLPNLGNRLKILDWVKKYLNLIKLNKKNLLI